MNRPWSTTVGLLAVGVCLAGLTALLAVASATGNEELGELGIDTLFVPVVIAAFFFGLRGGGVAVALGLTLIGALVALTDVYAPEVVLTNAVLLVVLGGIVGVATDRLRAQARMFQRRHELSLELLATMQDGRFVTVNPVWRERLGYAPEDLIGRDFLDFVHPEDRALVVDGRRRLADGGEVRGQGSRFRHADGDYVWIEWSARHDGSDRFNYIAGRDITAKKEAEAAVVEHQERLERAVAERTAELERRASEMEELARALDAARREDLRRLAIVAEFRDDKTAQHTERVGMLAALIARELGLSETEVASIREAAPLHDIGKIGTPDAILLNPDRLTEDEWEVMKQHTELGARILGESQTPVLQVAAEIARCHHEWWDGSGYPRGLTGERIPLCARIVALADVLDALTHARPYKPAWTLDEALEEIDALAARQFDPEVVEALHRLHDKRLLVLRDVDETARLVAAGQR